MSRSARILALVCALVVASALTGNEAMAAPIVGPGGKISPPALGTTVSVKSKDTATKAKDSTSTPSPIASKDTLSKPKVDSADLKQLPPRALPLKEQMMFAGGFMIFVAIMLTSMQNFNPND
ncbi:MAG: hypothetical protein RL173_245 [Fibrobacterota bacterium]